MSQIPHIVPAMGLHFDRTVSAALLGELKPGGRFDELVTRSQSMPKLADVQLRHTVGPVCHASLYIGLTSIIDIHERNGLFQLRTHSTHGVAGQFYPSWNAWRTAEELAAVWHNVVAYLDRILSFGAINPRWYGREGEVQAVVSSSCSPAYGPIQREAVPWSDSGPSVAKIVQEVSDRLWAAVQVSGNTDPWWPGVRDRAKRPAMGDEVDVVAVDNGQRLLCIEVKPAPETKGIVWAPAQVTVYAELFARWVDHDPSAATESMRSMAAQRSALGLLDPAWAAPVGDLHQVVPVVAVGAGLRSPVALQRLHRLCQAIAGIERHQRVAPLEVWLLDAGGHPDTIWYPFSEEPPGGRGAATSPVALLGSPPPDLEPVPAEPEPPLIPVPDPESFVAEARQAAIAWKASTPLLPEAGRQRAPYGSWHQLLSFVLPLEYRDLNLLPDAREVALTRFAAAGIHWHGDGIGPNPHLVSSQIQCLNALAPLVDAPEALAAWLRPYLPDLDEVIPFDAPTDSPYDATDHVVFEWQGLIDHLREWHGQQPTRGAMATSVDAAIRYRSTDGQTAMALIEWKYTESYPDGGRLAGTAAQHHRRLVRYRELFDDPDSPVELPDGVDYEDLFAEPVYQLLRQQLLAWRLEAEEELGIARAVVVHVAPSRNVALLRDSLGAPRSERHAHDHGGLTEGWKAMLRRPDRFVCIDSATLVAAGSMCGQDFQQRYAHMGGPSDHSPSVAGFPDPLGAAPIATAALDDALPARMTGQDLRTLAFEHGPEGVWVGRQGGLNGTPLRNDIATGAWRAWSYKVAGGIAAPNWRWFALEDLFDRVGAHRQAQRASAGWQIVGVVSVDSASIAVATRAAATRLQPDPVDDIAGMVVLITREDNDYPVETRTEGGQVVEVRVNLVDDVDELDGEWSGQQVFDVADDGVVVMDPYLERGDWDVELAPGVGRWAVGIFRFDGDDLALRLLRQPGA